MNTVSIIFLAVCVVIATVKAEYDVFELLKDNSVIIPRVVGGENAVRGQFPYQVSLRTKSDRRHFCGGSILSSRFIITAAHCTTDERAIPRNLIAVIGTIHRVIGGIDVELAKITVHEKWNRDKIENDISLIRTTKEIVFSKIIQPIALPTHNDAGNTQVVLSGWGRTSYPGTVADHLQFAKPQTLTKAVCIQKFEGTDAGPFVSDTVVCTTTPIDVGACHGDSGGPLVDISHPENKTLVGLASWVIPCAKGYPDVYTRVYSYLEWLENKMEEQSNE